RIAYKKPQRHAPVVTSSEMIATSPTARTRMGGNTPVRWNSLTRLLVVKHRNLCFITSLEVNYRFPRLSSARLAEPQDFKSEELSLLDLNTRSLCISIRKARDKKYLTVF